MKSKEIKTATTISQNFISHIRYIFSLSLEWAISESGRITQKNFSTPHALPAYPLSIVALEAWVGEAFLGENTKMIYNESVVFKTMKMIERLDIKNRLLLVPYLLFGRFPDNGTQPFQDTSMLIDIRNRITHYEMKYGIPKPIKTLQQKGIIISATMDSDISTDYPWPDKLSCIEGIRWAHNTVCDMVHCLFELTEGNLRSLLKHSLKNFERIDDTVVPSFLSKNGVDLSKLD